jgi:hypothetical protein
MEEKIEGWRLVHNESVNLLRSVARYIFHKRVPVPAIVNSLKNKP